MRRALRDNALSLTMSGLFLIFLLAQSVAGYLANHSENEQHGQSRESYAEYLTSGDFAEATFENWESEFLAVAVLAVLGIFLRQRGPPESKPVAAPHAQTGSS
jgi:hypothetical protein